MLLIKDLVHVAAGLFKAKAVIREIGTSADVYWGTVMVKETSEMRVR
jgi:hypothetical protein